MTAGRSVDTCEASGTGGWRSGRGAAWRLCAAVSIAGAVVACGDGAAAPGSELEEPVLRVVRGNAQISAAGTELPSALVVRATSARGKPLAGLTLDWAVTGDGRVDLERVATDDSGLVRAAWTLGTGVGRHVATATVGGHEVAFRATATEPLSLGSVRQLRLATFDGSGQLVHPDVARVPRGWAPARRFLAITPYPDGDVKRELPSVYASGDPTEWVAPEGVTNPVARTTRGYLSDPDLVFEPDRRELWMYYRHVGRRNTIILTTSADGSHWTTPVSLITARNHMIVSPAVVRVAAGDWHMWAVNAGTAGCSSQTTTVEHRTSIDGRHWSTARAVQVSGPGEMTPWHLDVAWVPELREFWTLYNEKPAFSCATPALRLATSSDGIHWTAYPTPVLQAGDVPQFKDVVYRSTFEYDARTDMVTLWYSGARKSDETWTWGAAVEWRSRRDLFRDVAAPSAARTAPDRGARPELLVAP